MIINNEFRDKGDDYRKGSENDVKRVKKQFERRGFQILECINTDESKMREELKELKSKCSKNADKISCLVVVMMSHGDSLRMKDILDLGKDKNDRDMQVSGLTGQGIFFSEEYERVKVEKIIKIFATEKSLEKKPKVFVVHACRGDIENSGEPSCWKDMDAAAPVPLMSDYLLAFPTPSSFVAYRSEKGSYFIQKLCDVLEKQEQYDRKDFCTILTEVAYGVVDDDKKCSQKDMPNYISFLRHKFVLPPHT